MNNRVPPLASLEQATAYLDGLLAGLYTHSSGGPPPLSQPIISDPAIAREILARPDIFVKNYAFLDDLGRGRFSSNGEDWRQRAALSQPWYRHAHKTIEADRIRDIYCRHLDCVAPLAAPALFHRFTAAAVEVFSHVLGLPTVLPWPAPIIDHLRAISRLRQWVSWHGCGGSDLQRVQMELATLRAQLHQIWQDEPSARALLTSLQTDGDHIDGFVAVEELLQNVIASSETTASALLWAAEALSQQAALQSRLAQDPADLDRFMAEVLRMFPPVPCLTRQCASTHTTGDGQTWRAGSILTISIVGVHRHPGHWQRPAEFDMTRPEFDGEGTPFAYMPFSRGERVCAGQRLAQVELRAALEALLALHVCRPGPTPTRFRFGLSSAPHTSLSAQPRCPLMASATGGQEFVTGT